MLFRIKLAAFASIIIASGATETTQTVVESPSGTTELENISAVADSTDRELYGSTDDVLRRKTDCSGDDEWFCETARECEESEAADVHGINGIITSRCMGGCVLKRNGEVSWVENTNSDWPDWDEFRSCAPERFSRVCCGPREIEAPTDSPTESPTWLDDSWGGDKWDGGSSNNNNKWGWSGGSIKNDDWGGWEPSMSKWNHDGWHQDGWQDDGWNDDGHNQVGWKGDDDRARLRQCDLSDCCEADRRGRDFSLYNRFIRSENSDGFCRLSGQDGGTAQREQCNRRGFCYATGENCQPSDCR
mmetsp:Transcript_15001/g.19126  ORF Transcript_15001/g.19126 Transcript_15001/m.19126 type:complete len:302 (+) Transcript_15001:162-1067(+)